MNQADDLSVKRLAAVISFLVLVAGTAISGTMWVVSSVTTIRTEQSAGFHRIELQLLDIERNVEENHERAAESVSLSAMRAWSRVLRAENPELTVPDLIDQ